MAVDLKGSCPIHDFQTGRDTQGQPESDAQFDRWLTHHLGRLYGQLIEDPLPAEMLRLLEQRLK